MKNAGFSMVEVVLTLGIISFALVSIFGLLSVGLTANKQSRQDAVIASMTTQITSRLQVGRDKLTIGTISNYFFDNQGRLQTTETDQPTISAISDTQYQCQVIGRLPDASTEVPDLGAHLTVMSLDFSWPTAVSNPAERPNHEVLHATLVY